jgi:aspartyl-tRNA(Asn)/glutamyl-tRNA(Gln) amidotransferase subunit A
MPKTPTLASLADDLASGRTSARKLVDECLARIADKSGEGARAFIRVDAEAAIEAAEAMDRLREVKAAPSPYAGIPVSIKDLFDIKGQVTRAGSRALEDSPPAEDDAPVVARGCARLHRDRPNERDRVRPLGSSIRTLAPEGAWHRAWAICRVGRRQARRWHPSSSHGAALGTDTGGSMPDCVPTTYRRLPADAASCAARWRRAAIVRSTVGPARPLQSVCSVLDRARQQARCSCCNLAQSGRLAVPTVALGELDDAVARFDAHWKHCAVLISGSPYRNSSTLRR